MAEIVNLRMARKARERRTSAEVAAHNRAAHGRTLAERRSAEAGRERLERTVDNARRTHGTEPEKP